MIFREVRDCLKLDPEHKDCFPHYKKVKKIDKFWNDIQDAINSQNYDTCVDSAQKVYSYSVFVIILVLIYQY